MEILILPILVFIFVLLVIILFNQLSTCKKKLDKTEQDLQMQLKRKRALPVDTEMNQPDLTLENTQKEYNKTVTKYNTLIQKFPTSIMAGMAGYTRRELVEDSDLKI